MKTTILHLLFLAFALNGFSQIFGPYQTIDPSVNNIDDMTILDLNGDGLQDIVYVELISTGDSTGLYWRAGNGVDGFGPEVEIEFSEDGTYDLVEGADLDGDGDVDLVTSHFAGFLIGDVALYINNGDGSFMDREVLVTDSDQNVGLILNDLDNDGDIDIIIGSQQDDVFSWLINDGSADFSSIVNLASAPEGFRELELWDMDGDGDNDLVFSEIGSEEGVGWVEASPGLSFTTTHYLDQDVHAPFRKSFGDIDGDGDNDLLVSSFDGLIWYSNLGGGNFSTPNIVPQPSGLFWHIISHLADVDSDGDLDILFSTVSNKYGWVENTGSGVFNEATILNSSLDEIRGFELMDVDGDGDRDLVGASQNGFPSIGAADVLFWVESDIVNNLSENIESFVSIFPNPSVDVLNVQTTEALHELQYEILDQQGRVVILDRFSSAQLAYRVSVSDLSDGLYYLRLISNGRLHTEKIIVKNN